MDFVAPRGLVDLLANRLQRFARLADRRRSRRCARAPTPRRVGTTPPRPACPRALRAAPTGTRRPCPRGFPPRAAIAPPGAAEGASCPRRRTASRADLRRVSSRWLSACAGKLFHRSLRVVEFERPTIGRPRARRPSRARRRPSAHPQPFSPRATPPRAPDERPVAQVHHRLADLGLGVHHDRPVPGDRLAQAAGRRRAGSARPRRPPGR